MPTATKSPTKVTTGKVRLSYVHLFEPWAQNSEQEAKYSTTILIPKSDKVTVNKIKAAIDAAAEEGKTRVFGGKIPAALKTTLHDGDEEADLEKNPEYAGHYYMSLSSKARPGIVDLNLDPIIDPMQVYSGCYARVSMGAFAYNTSGNRGISFGLNNVQFVDDGPSLGGRSRAEDDFADELDEESLL